MTSVPPGDPGLHRDVVARLDWLTKPGAALQQVGPPLRPGASQLGGYPYLPFGQTWPDSAAGPCIFLVQINFAETPALPGFPTRGLLQWFVEPTDSYGLTFDNSSGATGFRVRWYPDPAMTASLVTPDQPTPADHVRAQPMEVDPAALRFRLVPTLPCWQDLPEVARQDPIWGRLCAAHADDPGDPALGYEEYARGSSAPYGRHAPGSKVGGFPSFTQEPPYGFGSYPPLTSPAAANLIELDAGDVGGWGDYGIAHLFGDPAALARDDLSTIRYHWDCT